MCCGQWPLVWDQRVAVPALSPRITCGHGEWLSFLCIFAATFTFPTEKKKGAKYSHKVRTVTETNVNATDAKQRQGCVTQHCRDNNKPGAYPLRGLLCPHFNWQLLVANIIMDRYMSCPIRDSSSHGTTSMLAMFIYSVGGSDDVCGCGWNNNNNSVLHLTVSFEA